MSTDKERLIVTAISPALVDAVNDPNTDWAAITDYSPMNEYALITDEAVIAEYAKAGHDMSIPHHMNCVELGCARCDVVWAEYRKAQGWDQPLAGTEQHGSTP